MNVIVDIKYTKPIINIATSHGLISHGIVSLSLWILCMCKRFHVASTQFINHIHTALDFSAASISRNNCLTIFFRTFWWYYYVYTGETVAPTNEKKIPRWLIRYNRAAIDISIKWFIIYQIVLITSGLKWNFHCRTVKVSWASIAALTTVLIRMSSKKIYFTFFLLVRWNLPKFASIIWKIKILRISTVRN